MTDKQIPNSLSRPNMRLHIGLVTETFNKNSLEHTAIKQLIEKTGNYEFMMNYTYAVYADYNLLQQHIMLPVFHTYHLNSDTKKLIFLDDRMLHLANIYPYHKFYVFEKYENMPNNISVINSIEEIINEELQ